MTQPMLPAGFKAIPVESGNIIVRDPPPPGCRTGRLIRLWLSDPMIQSESDETIAKWLGGVVTADEVRTAREELGIPPALVVLAG